MSHDPNPSSASLRLKPRLQPAAGSGVVGVAADSGGGPAVNVASPVGPTTPGLTPAATPATEDSSTQKVRLRPKLQPAVAAVAPAAVAGSQAAPPPVPDRPATPPARPTPPPLFISASPPAAPAPPSPPVSAAPPPAIPAASPAAALGDPGKFRLKPKTTSAAPAAPAAGSPPVPPLFLPNDLPATAPGQSPAPAPAAGPGGPPPVSRPGSDSAGRAGKPTAPLPVPYVKVDAADLVPEVNIVAPARPVRRRGVGKFLVVVAVLAGAGYAAYSAWPKLPAEFSVAGYTVRTKPSFAIVKSRAAAPRAAPSPSETLNKLAHLPGNAINKAQDALAARRASGQDRVDAASIGEDLTTKTFGVPPAAPIKPAAPPPKVPATTTSVTTVAPGLSATTPVEAAPDAAPEFRALIVNARVSGVFQGNPARAVINGRLMRVGEVVDAGLGITFEGIAPDRRSLVFKDRGGAIVTRRF